jgi:hypothetical protein
MWVRRVLVLVVAYLAAAVPALAQDASLAPADEYFGRFNLSVLGIANSIRDSGTRIDAGDDPAQLFRGPLAFATDAIHAWEERYPDDPWIAKDLLALETVYLKVPTDDGFRLASSTEAWLLSDFPTSAYGAQAQQRLAAASGNGNAAADPNAGADANTMADAGPTTFWTLSTAPVNAWERFAAMRVPLPPDR